MRRWLRRVALAGALLVVGCGEQKAAAPASGADPERGRQVYQAYCTSCHSPDPAQDGPVGPAVKGASRELLEARVVQGTYPPGYRPKRPSAVMQPLPQLAPEIPNLTAYLR